jgi:hypothetical protein
MREFFGSDLDHAAYEELRINHISESLSKKEPSLFESKWWDYKFFHPTQSTYLFAECYRQAVKDSIRRRVDLAMSRVEYGMPREDLFACKKTFITGMWKGRQEADAHGIPYETWCSFAIIYAEKNLWLRVPQPNQLYAKKINPEHEHFKIPMVDFIKNKWADKNAGLVVCAKSQEYRTQAWVGNSHQKDHFVSLKKQVRESRNKAMVVHDLIYEKGLLTETQVRLILGSEAEAILIRAKNFN